MAEDDRSDTSPDPQDDQVVHIEAVIDSDPETNNIPDAEVSQTDTPNKDIEVVLQELADVKTQLASLKQEIIERLRYDETKERAFERLYTELDELKRDAAFNQLRPLYTDLILLFDRIDNLSESLPHDAVPAVDYVNTLKTFRDELRELLSRRGVDMIQTNQPEFDSAWQRAVGTEDTVNDHDDGHVARVVRKGFAAEDRLIRPEEVIVKRFKPGPSEDTVSKGHDPEKDSTPVVGTDCESRD
ncbi:MAG: nucleotide exchange factor GrpE [Candidatus Thiodiazotropha sp. (ex Ctena orbiculata)]|nr:nucleotide exchange factor GrpE [Candidatus Thiodiazotropha taylori]